MTLAAASAVSAKKRDLFEEIREGLEAYRDRRDTLSRRGLFAPDIDMIRKTADTISATAAKKTCRRRVG